MKLVKSTPEEDKEFYEDMELYYPPKGIARIYIIEAIEERIKGKREKRENYPDMLSRVKDLYIATANNPSNPIIRNRMNELYDFMYSHLDTFFDEPEIEAREIIEALKACEEKAHTTQEFCEMFIQKLTPGK